MVTSKLHGGRKVGVIRESRRVGYTQLRVQYQQCIHGIIAINKCV